MTLLAEAGDTALHPIPVAIAIDRGPLVSRAKSDASDAVLLANIRCTDPRAHQVLPADTQLAQAIPVLTGAQQEAVWPQWHIRNRLVQRHQFNNSLGQLLR